MPSSNTNPIENFDISQTNHSEKKDQVSSERVLSLLTEKLKNLKAMREQAESLWKSNQTNHSAEFLKLKIEEIEMVEKLIEFNHSRIKKQGKPWLSLNSPLIFKWLTFYVLFL